MTASSELPMQIVEAARDIEVRLGHMADDLFEIGIRMDAQGGALDIAVGRMKGICDQMDRVDDRLARLEGRLDGILGRMN